MLNKIYCYISFYLNKINKTECKNCKWFDRGTCAGGMQRYMGCCGWINKNFESNKTKQ